MVVIQFVLSPQQQVSGNPLWCSVRHTLNGKRCKFRLIHAKFTCTTGTAGTVVYPEIPLALDFVSVVELISTVAGNIVQDFSISSTPSLRPDVSSSCILLQGRVRDAPGRIFVPNQYPDQTGVFTYAPPTKHEFTGICLGDTLTLALNSSYNSPGVYTFSGTSDATSRIQCVIVTFDVEVL